MILLGIFRRVTQNKSFFLILGLLILVVYFAFFGYLAYFKPLKQKKLELKELPSFIEKYYANWHNQTEHKQKILQVIKKKIHEFEYQESQSLSFEKKKNLEFKTFQEIQQLLYHFQDAHVMLSLDQKGVSLRSESENTFLKSQIEIDFFNLTIKKCINCQSYVGFKLKKIDGLTLEDWHEMTEKRQTFKVYASSSWGRLYRKLQFLEQKKTTDPEIKTLELEDSARKLVQLRLRWETQNQNEQLEQDQKNNMKCVEFERLKHNKVVIHIFKFWCEPVINQGLVLSRNDILMNFKNHYLKALSLIEPQDEVVIDVSKNTGGGDDEVDFVLNSILKNQTEKELYKYQFLARTALSESVNLENIYQLIRAILKSDDWLEIKKYSLKRAPTGVVLNLNLKNIKEVRFSPLCSSACELFVLALKKYVPGVAQGERTQGSLGLPLYYPIQTKYNAELKVSLTLPACRVFDLNGNLLEGTGI